MQNKKTRKPTGKQGIRERVMLDERVQKLIDKLDAEYAQMRAHLNSVFTRNEMRGILLLMEIMQLDEIDVRRMRQFIDSTRKEVKP